MFLFTLILGFIIAVNIFLFTLFLNKYKKEAKEYKEDFTDMTFELERAKKEVITLAKKVEKELKAHDEDENNTLTASDN